MKVSEICDSHSSIYWECYNKLRDLDHVASVGIIIKYKNVEDKFNYSYTYPIDYNVLFKIILRHIKYDIGKFYYRIKRKLNG